MHFLIAWDMYLESEEEILDENWFIKEPINF